MPKIEGAMFSEIFPPPKIVGWCHYFAPRSAARNLAIQQNLPLFDVFGCPDLWSAAPSCHYNSSFLEWSVYQKPRLFFSACGYPMFYRFRCLGSPSRKQGLPIGMLRSERRFAIDVRCRPVFLLHSRGLSSVGHVLGLLCGVLPSLGRFRGGWTGRRLRLIVLRKRPNDPLTSFLDRTQVISLRGSRTPEADEAITSTGRRHQVGR